MKKRLGLTLLEIIVAMACMGLLIFTGWSLLNNVVNQSAKAIGNVATQTEAKHVVESMIAIVKNATELEILNTTPTTEQMTNSGSKYIYSDNGVVHYFDGTNDIPIRSDENPVNDLLFSGENGGDILEYEITSKRGDEEYKSNSSIILNSIENGIVNNVVSGHCIKFKAESNIAIIVEFNLLKVNNSGDGINEDIIGYVADGYIEVWVPKEVSDLTGLYPSVKFFGDSVVVSYTPLTDEEVKNKTSAGEIAGEINDYELTPTATDFDNPVYYYVIKNDIVKEYKVVVKQDTEEMKVQIRQGNNIVGWQDEDEAARTSDKTIVFDEDFVAYVPSSNKEGTYSWYVQGVKDPIKSSSSNILTVQELANHNNASAPEIEGGINKSIDANKYDSQNPNDNEDAMLYLMVKFTPRASTPGGAITSNPVLVYPVTRNDLWKKFDDFYFKITTDVWVQSRLLENKLEDKDSNTGKTGEQMAQDFMKWYAVNTSTTYDPESVKLNNKKATDVNKVYTDTFNPLISYNNGYDKAPEIIRTMYKMSPTGIGGKYEVKPIIFVCGDNTTSTPAVVNTSAEKHANAPYARTAFGIDVDYFNKNINTLGTNPLNNEPIKITDIVTDKEDGLVNTYQFSITYAPGNLDYVDVNNKKINIDVKEKAEIQKLSVGLFNDENGNGFRYMTGGNTEPQLSNKGYLKVVNHSDIFTSMYMSPYPGFIPYESGNVFGANIMQEYVLNKSLKNTPSDKLESITLIVNTVRQADTYKAINTASQYETQGKSVNTYVTILKNGEKVKGALPTPSNTGELNAYNVSRNLFTSDQTADLMIGNTPIYIRKSAGRTALGAQTADPEMSGMAGPGYGAPGYVGSAYNTWYEDMLIGDNLYSANYDGRYGGNLIRTNTTQKQTTRTFGSTTVGNIITVGSANDSHENNNPRSTAGANATKKLDNDQYVHYITDMDLTAGYESEEIEVLEAKVISNLKIDGVDVTAVEMKFNKPIRSGYGPKLYELDGVQIANIDSSIKSYLISNDGKNVPMSKVDNTSSLPVMEPAFVYVFVESFSTYVNNLNARDIKISDGNTKYQIYRNNDYAPAATPDKIGDQHFVYKTGEDTLVAIVKGTLDRSKTYDIEFKRGSVQAMIGGAVPIKNGQIKPNVVEVDNVAWSIIPDGLQVDENGGLTFSIDLSEAGGHATTNVSEDGESVYLRAAQQYYRDTGYVKDNLRQNVNLKDGFVVTVKSMKEKPYEQWNNNAFSAVTVYNNQNDIGYALVMTDYTFGWGGDFDSVSKPNFGIHAIKNHLPMDSSGQIISSTNSSNYEMIGLRNGKVYYDRVGGKYYTYKATFKANTIKLEVFDENNVLLDFRNVTIPNAQYNLQKDLEFNTIDMQSGRNNTYFKQISVDFLQ